MKGNTVGSRLSVEKAYIAGFLDGDGSIILQLKKRSDTKRGYRFMATICFYQDTRHDKTLYWIQKVLGIGYISKRKDHITELRINGFDRIEKILLDLKPFIRFKAVQAKAMLNACRILRKDINMLSKKELLMLVDVVLTIQSENYVTNRKKSKEELLDALGLSP